MNAVEFFSHLGVLKEVRWKHKEDAKYTARVDRLVGQLIHVSVRLPYCGTWVREKPKKVEDFLTSFRPQR